MDIKKILDTEDSKFNFLAGLIRISKANGEISPEEKEFFDNVLLGMNINQENRNILNTYWDRAEKIELKFENTVQSMFFLTQAVQLSEVDGCYDESERKEMKQITKELGISQEALKKVEDWVEEGINWSLKGEKLLDLK